MSAILYPIYPSLSPVGHATVSMDVGPVRLYSSKACVSINNFLWKKLKFNLDIILNLVHKKIQNNISLCKIRLIIIRPIYIMTRWVTRLSTVDYTHYYIIKKYKPHFYQVLRSETYTETIMRWTIITKPMKDTKPESICKLIMATLHHDWLFLIQHKKDIYPLVTIYI